jgi:hypothetical protein
MRNALKHLPVGAAGRRLLPIASGVPLLPCRCQGPKARHSLLHNTSVRCLENGHAEAGASSGVSAASAYLMDAALMPAEMASDPVLLATLVDIMSPDAQGDHAAAGSEQRGPRTVKGRSGYLGFCLNCCSPTVISFCEVRRRSRCWERGAALLQRA